MRIILPLLSILVLASCQPMVTLHNVPGKAELYSPVFVDFEVAQSFNNPFDRHEVSVDALIVTERADTLVLPCFYLQGDGQSPRWQARYTPRAVGAQTFQIRVVTTASTVLSKRFEMEVMASSHRGMLSLDKSNPYFFKADNGDKVRGLGMNVGWEFEPKWDSEPKYTYHHYLDQMSQHGANFLRVWICPWNMPIEWSPVKSYPIQFEDFADTRQMDSFSSGFAIQPGQNVISQADNYQLVKTGKGSDSIVYRIDSLRAVKMMVYYRENLNKSQVKLYGSADGVHYQEVPVSWSDHWGSVPKWERIFLYNSDELPQGTNYAKLVFGPEITADNARFAGIQFKHGAVSSQLDCDGLSRFSPSNSLKLDSLVDMASSKQMYMMLCFQYHGVFNPIMDSWGANDEWQRNPYNVKNGGPCEQPGDFFSNAVAMDHYKNYLRYLVARWGYSDAIAVWELWNEILDHPNLDNWHREMTDYLHSIDPYGHVITTSTMHPDQHPAIWNLPNIDITQTHRYQPSTHFVAQTAEYIHRYNKPHCIGEYAVDWKGPGNGYTDADYENEFRFGMWRGLMTPVSIMPMSWWWDYHMELGQFKYFLPLRMMIDEMAAQQGALSSLDVPQPSGLEVVGVKSDKSAFVWINRTDKTTPAKITIPVSKAGRYSLRLLDTKTSQWTSLKEVEANDGAVVLPNLDFSAFNDVALVLTSIE